MMVQHGFVELPYHVLEKAEMRHRHGCGLLLTSTRGHNLSDGELISFGCYEIEDLEAWYQYLLTRDDVDPEKNGILGQSMGGSLAIQYGQMNDNVQAVVTHSAFSSVADVFERGAETEFPSFPKWLLPVFSGTLVFWIEQELDCNVDDTNGKIWIQEISPRAVFIIDAEKNGRINLDAGELLYETANEPKAFWQCTVTK